MASIPIAMIPLFFDLVTSKNISRSAKNLGISQPALSRQLKLLEEELGVALFIRGSRGLSLTSAAQQIRDRLGPSFLKFKEDLDELKDQAHSISGHIVVGCYFDFGQTWLFPRMIKFKEQYPKVSLELRLMSGSQITAEILQGQIDFGVSSQMPSVDFIRAYPLITENIVMLTASHNTLDIEAHPDPQFIGYRLHDVQLASFLKSSPPLKRYVDKPIALSVNSHDSMMDAAAKLSMYICVPERVAQNFLKSGKLRIASKYKVMNKINLFIPGKKNLEPKRNTVFLEYLRKESKGNMN